MTLHGLNRVLTVFRQLKKRINLHEVDNTPWPSDSLTDMNDHAIQVQPTKKLLGKWVECDEELLQAVLRQTVPCAHLTFIH